MQHKLIHKFIFLVLSLSIILFTFIKLHSIYVSNLQNSDKKDHVTFKEPKTIYNPKLTLQNNSKEDHVTFKEPKTIYNPKLTLQNNSKEDHVTFKEPKTIYNPKLTLQNNSKEDHVTFKEPKTTHDFKLINNKIDIIAKVIWCEDRRSELGMKLVLSVIHNRASSKTLDGLYNEIKKPYQFECYSIMKKRDHFIKEPKMYKEAKKLVISYKNGLFTPVINAKYFFNPKKLKGKFPKWSLNKKLVYIHDGHWFYS